MADVELVEVGPRDGFQAITTFIPTEQKLRIIEQLAASGYRRIEVCSFVKPNAVPQMRDAEAVLTASKAIDGLVPMCLVPNMKGAERAICAGAPMLVYVCSASESHNRSNVRRPVAESLVDLRAIVTSAARPAGVRLRLDVSTAFDCPYDGAVPEESVFKVLDAAFEADVYMEIALCDTTGCASPWAVAHRFKACMERYGAGRRWAFHGHDTYGFGIANAIEAYRAGVRIFDGALAGLGGCPFAPGATGNTASEDLVYLFREMGRKTGIDLGALLAAADLAATLPGACVGGHIRAVPRRRLMV